MKLINDKNILIVGLGLLGGSYAMALKRRGYHVSAITLEQESIDYAINNDIIDEGEACVSKRLIEEADIVIFALYPHVLLSWIKENQSYFKQGAILTDVTGVKAPIVYEIQQMLRNDVEFIAAHPMAGKEVSGVENSDDAIFRDANYIIVPTEKNSEDAIEFAKSLGNMLGFKTVSVLDPEKHDEMIAFLSQLTHCIAVSLMCSSDNPELVKFTGDSFRDLTRIAKINENMWSELFLLNKEQLLSSMDKFLESFIKLKNTIENENVEEMKEMMQLSTKRRKLFDKPKK